MNKILQYLIALVLIMTTSGCYEDFLEIVPQDNLVTDSFFRTDAEIRAGTAALYGMPWFDYNDKFSWVAGDAMPGNLYHTWDQEGQFFFFSFNEGNAHLTRGWQSLFRVVSYSNSIINDLPRIAGGYGVPQEYIDRGVGEARFIRAFAYFILAEYWGEVPIVENSTTLVSNNTLILPKNTKSSVYEFIRRDLEFAEQHLLNSDAPGRVTKWSAKALMAKLYLTMGQASGSADHYNKAKQYSEDLIENSGLTLMPDYSNLFKIENNNNPESLFALQWVEGAYGSGNSVQANMARSSMITGNSESWGGFKSLTYDFTKNVEDGDLRQPAIYMTLGNHYPEIRRSAGGYSYLIVNRDAQNNILENAAPVLNNVKKYVVGSSADTGGKVTTNQATAMNTYMLRLADAYLTYAEAALGTAASTNDGKALGYFNAIRSRAGLDPLNSLTFMDILKERRIEFGMEGQYWMDIKRYFYRNPSEAVSYLNSQQRAHFYERVQGTNPPDENSLEGYVLMPPTSPVTVFESNMILPIPAAEVSYNPLLAPGQPAVEYEFN
ncbi:RagB/SusD family nutrient uptake outer membrane protein [Aquiflexum sp.]|uniref:RagB/SusD family nutrient uptake outer membrane protein n=1 Tax=Aquiflexum sp. TaxID=1872584 RepID=UPI003593FFF6